MLLYVKTKDSFSIAFGRDILWFLNVKYTTMSRNIVCWSRLTEAKPVPLDRTVFHYHLSNDGIIVRMSSEIEILNMFCIRIRWLLQRKVTCCEFKPLTSWNTWKAMSQSDGTKTPYCWYNLPFRVDSCIDSLVLNQSTLELVNYQRLLSL